MKNILVIICFIIGVLSIEAQHGSSASSPNMTTIFKSQLDEAVSQGEFDKVLSIADSVMYYAEKENEWKTLADVNVAKAEIYKFRSEYEEALVCVKRAISVYEERDYKRNLVGLYASLADTYGEMGELDAAKNALHKAQINVTDTTRLDLLSYYYDKQSIYFQNTARLDSAIHYVLERIKIMDSLNPYKLSGVNTRLATLFYKVSDYDKSLVYLNMALQEIEKSPASLEITKLQALSLKAKVCFKLDKADEAIAIAQEMIRLSEAQRRPEFEVSAKVMLSQYYFDSQAQNPERFALHDSVIGDKKLPNLELFEFYLTQLEQHLILKNKKKTGGLHMQLTQLLPHISALGRKQRYYSLSATYYKSVENYEASLMANDQYLEISQQINDRNKLYSLYDLETKYQTVKKDKVIAESELEIEKSRAKTQLMNILLIVLLLFSILLWVIFRQRQKRIQQQLIAVQKEQEVLTLESIIEGEEQERLRIAKELHDGVNGDLSAIKYKLASLQKMNNEVINQAVTMIDNSCDQVRAISHNLVPPSLKDFNLKEAVSNYCENMDSIHKPNISFQYIGEALDLSKKSEVNIFRIIQELVTNSIKHAEAINIDVQLSCRDNILLVSVEDNGKGYEINSKESNGIGLTNVQSRVAYLEASLDVTTNEKGTYNTLEIDLNKIHDN